MSSDTEAKKLKYEKDISNATDYRGILSPVRDEVIADKGEQGTKNVFKLTDYHWFPEGFFSMFYTDELFPDLITDMVNDLTGNEPLGLGASMMGGFMFGGVKGAGGVLGSAIKKGFGDAKDSFLGKKDEPVTKDDPKFMDNNEHADRLMSHIPHIIITEFQAHGELAEAMNKFMQIRELLVSIIEGGATTSIKALTNVVGEGGSGFKNLIADIAGIPPDATQAERDIIHIPNFFYEHMVTGHYTAQYHVPFSGQATYLNAKGATGWESRSMKQQFFGNMISGLVDKIPGLGDIDIAGRPKFNLEGNNPVPDQISVTFNLFNYDMKALARNIQFIHSITAGAYWIQSGLIQLPSTLYDIEIPGRLRYYLCKGNVRVDFVGKVRTLTDYTLGALRRECACLKKVDDRALQTVPDSYKITLEFTSMMPNNFNTYMNYIHGAKTVSIGEFKQSAGTKALESFNKEFKAEQTKLTPPSDGTTATDLGVDVISHG